jgi:prolyl-tRNA synthetase
MYDAYCDIFRRCGLEIVIADADSGAMGGSGSQEFMVLNDIGEDKIVKCTSCSYTANLEKAEIVLKDDLSCDNTLLDKELIHTPNVRTIDELCAFLGCSSSNFAKT